MFVKLNKVNILKNPHRSNFPLLFFKRGFFRGANERGGKMGVNGGKCMGDGFKVKTTKILRNFISATTAELQADTGVNEREQHEKRDKFKQYLQIRKHFTSLKFLNSKAKMLFLPH